MHLDVPKKFILDSSDLQQEVIEKNFNNLNEKCSDRFMLNDERGLEGKVFVLFLSLILVMNLKRRLTRARKSERSDSVLKYLPDDTSEFMRVARAYRAIGGDRRLMQDKFREALKSLQIDLP